jgi:tetratricopeptide (TPR) repeat protein
MIRLACRIWRSRVLTILLAGIILFCAAFLLRNVLPFGGPRLASVIQPKLDSAEPGVRAHVQSTREQVDAVVRNRSAEPSARAAAYAELGKVYLTYNFPEAATVCFRNAAKLDPDDFRWRYLLALSLQQDTQTAEAASHMAAALDRMQKQGGHRVERAAALCFIGEGAIRLNKPDEAKKAFTAVIQDAPQHAFALFKLGQLAARAGEGDEALSFFERARKIAPNRAEIGQALGAEYRRRGDAQKASAFPPVEASDDARRPWRYPDPILASVTAVNQSAKRLTQAGVQKAGAGHWVEALDLFEKARRSNSDHLPAIANYGRALIAMGRNHEAQGPLAEALRRKSGDSGLRRDLCLAKAGYEPTRQEGFDEAARWRKDEPTSQHALLTFAEVAAIAHRYGEALDAYREAVARYPGEVWPHTGFASMLAAIGKGGDARAELERAGRLHPDQASLRLHLARLLGASPDARARDPKRSLSIMQALIEQQGSAVRQETLAIALAATGDFQAAAGVQRKALASVRGVAQLSIQLRADAILRAFERRQPWREPWPFGAMELEITE